MIETIRIKVIGQRRTDIAFKESLIRNIKMSLLRKLATALVLAVTVPALAVAGHHGQKKDIVDVAVKYPNLNLNLITLTNIQDIKTTSMMVLI